MLGLISQKLGADGKVISYLTSPSVVQDIIIIGGEQKQEERNGGEGGRKGRRGRWDVRVLLEVVARREGVHSLIDTGALVTGMTNLEVAKFLLMVCVVLWVLVFVLFRF